MNGDGIPDIAVGARDEDVGGIVNNGRMYIFSGTDGTLITVIDNPNPSPGSTFSSSIAKIGDVNGDGNPDFVVGAPGPAAALGSAYVFSGSNGNLLQTVSFDPDPPVFVTTFGTAVAGVGDIGRGGGGAPDGVPDFAVSEPRHTLVGGSTTQLVHIFSGADGDRIMVLSGITPGDGFGAGIAGIGNIDGDNVPDLAVGATGGLGRVYVISGASGSLLQTIHHPDPNIGNSGGFGFMVTSVGDVGGGSSGGPDGVQDLAVSANSQNVGGFNNIGQVYVFSGDDGSLLHTINSPLQVNLARFGLALVSLDDVNGDTVPDFAASAPNDSPDPGKVFVFSGVDASILQTLESPTPDGEAFFGISLAALSSPDQDIGVGDNGVDATFRNQGRAFTYEFNNRPIADAGLDQTIHQGELVILDGFGSSDPDGDHPLTYAWQIISQPPGGTATLSDPAVVDPELSASLLGDYIIELVVTDSIGFISPPDQVTVSTFNSAPVADAGPDQVIDLIGITVLLDGTQSDDDDGDAFTALWSFTSKPVGSSATLSDPTLLTPSFVVDVHGDYVLSLVVTDIFVAESAPDSVMVTFNNAPPVADAGVNQAGIVGDIITLDGTGSSDANNDAITYSWSFVSVPASSLAALDDPSSPQPQFTADLQGTYIVSLVVNDGFENSIPSNVETQITGDPVSATEFLELAIDIINGIPEDLSHFNKVKNQNRLTNRINKAIASINKGKFAQAKNQLEKILIRMDGCATSGVPDRNDWIIMCADQDEVYPIILTAITQVSEMI